MSIPELEDQINLVEQAIRPLEQQLKQLRLSLRKEKSREFIRVNAIRAEDVEMSGGEGKPYFGQVGFFISWIRSHSSKNWAEWNGQIHRTSDLLNNRWSDTGAYADDLV